MILLRKEKAQEADDILQKLFPIQIIKMIYRFSQMRQL